MSDMPPPAKQEWPEPDLGNPLLDGAWDRYARGGGYVTQEQATYIWQQIHNLSHQSDELYKLITLVRHIDAQATRGQRCSVCAAIEGNHDDC